MKIVKKLKLSYDETRVLRFFRNFIAINMNYHYTAYEQVPF